MSVVLKQAELLVTKDQILLQMTPPYILGFLEYLMCKKLKFHLKK